MKHIYDHLEDIEHQIGYTFINKDLLIQAFTRKTYAIENGGSHQETLEWIGDSILYQVVTEMIISKFGYFQSEFNDYDPEIDMNGFLVDRYDNEGKLTKLRQRFINQTMLAHRMDILGFKEYLLLGKGDFKRHLQDEPSVKEDLFEAIIGAIAVDSRWDWDCLKEAIKFMLPVDYYLEHGFDESEDYTGLLQTWHQKEFGSAPYYEFKENYYGGYKVYLRLETERGTMIYQAEDESKSKARSIVASIAYRDLINHDEVYTILDDIPEDLSMDNSINVLQELFQKGYCSNPEYVIPEDSFMDHNGNIRWYCSVIIDSENINIKTHATSKRLAKKYAAYLAICHIANLEDKYNN